MRSPAPPIGTRGRYELKAPFQARPDRVYTCSAIRKFVDLENQGINIFLRYYDPLGLEDSDFAQDKRNGELLLTLTSETEAPIYVPTSYLLSFPNQSGRRYHHVVLSASMGPIPDYIDLTHVRVEMANVISDAIGHVPEVHVGVSPLTQDVTPEEHESLEAARVAAITNRTTDYTRFLAERQKVARLEAKLAALEEILRVNGLIPST
jgi:hypothetical protein